METRQKSSDTEDVKHDTKDIKLDMEGESAMEMKTECIEPPTTDDHDETGEFIFITNWVMYFIQWIFK